MALGILTEANGNRSLAGGGPATVTNGFNSFAWGAGNTTAALAHNSLAFGQGTSANARQSMTGGNSTTTNANNSIAWGHTNTTFSSAINSVAFGENSKTIGAQSLAGGSNGTTTEGDNSFAFGKQCSTSVAAVNSVSIGEDNISFGGNSISSGYKTEARGDQSFSGGRSLTTTTVANGHSSIAYGTDVVTTSNADNSFAMGENTTTNGHQSFAGGSNGTSTNADNSIAFGNNTTTGSFANNAIAFGDGTQANGAQSLVGGNNGSSANGTNSISWGDNTTTTPAAINGIATGLNNITSGSQAISGGDNSSAIGTNSISWGHNVITSSSAVNSMVIGSFNTVNNQMSFSGGVGNTCNGANSFSFGSNNLTFPAATNSIAFGKLTEARGNQAISGGEETKSISNNSIAWGYRSSVDQVNSIACGTNCTIITPPMGNGGGSAAFGFGVDVQGDMAFGTGNHTQAWGDMSCAFNGGTMAHGIKSAAFGELCLAADWHSFATGHITQALGRQSATFGDGTRAGKLFPAVNPPQTDNDFATGVNTVAEGGSSFTMGGGTWAKGFAAFASGSLTVAEGQNSTSKGDSTWAFGNNSVSTGDSTTAAGRNSFTTGSFTHANQINSQAHGQDVVNNGINSFAQGQRIISNADNNVTFGLGGTNTWLDNSQSQSFMVGFDSDAPTLFVSSASGNGTTGNVGIGGPGYTPLTTPNPLEKLEVWNGNIAQTNVDQVATTTATTANSSTNLLGLSPGTCPVFGLTTNNLGSSNTISGIANSFVQVGVNSTNPEVRWGGSTTGGILAFNVDNTITACNSINVFEVADPGSGLLGTGIAMFVHGDGIYNLNWTASDLRFKTDISPINKPTELISKISGKKYKFKTEEFKSRNFTSNYTYGFIAQELIDVIPEAVTTDKDGYYAVNYPIFIPFLVEVVKEQQKKIDSLIQSNNHATTISLDTISSSPTQVGLVQLLDNKVDSAINVIDSQKVVIETLVTQFEYQTTKINELTERLDLLIECISNKGLCSSFSKENTDDGDTDKAVLYQNVPNPYEYKTSIPYYLPSMKGNCFIEFYTSSGIVLQKVKLNKTGFSTVEFSSENEVNGTLYYRMIVNEQIIGTFKMLHLQK